MMLNTKKMNTIKALDKIVCERVQHFENVHTRCKSLIQIDEKTGDEFITVYDPITDQCLTVWSSPNWYGNDVLEVTRTVIRGEISR